MANPRTLFHLVPLNDIARSALTHPDNKRFISRTNEGDLGLEVGFHVTSTPGRVMARLGRDADLILQARTISAVHVAFELHPETLFVLLSVRSKRTSSVTVSALKEERRIVNEVPVIMKPIEEKPFEGAADEEEEIEGDCVISYGKGYKIKIAAYRFRLEWRQSETPQSLRALAIQDYENALQQLVNVRSRNLPTEGGSEYHTWHNTRIHSARRQLVREADWETRVRIGKGSYGEVYKACDYETGFPFAIKVLRLSNYDKPEEARASAHREIKTHQDLRHKNIIEFLGHAKWDSEDPEIYLPLREGNLRSLRDSQGTSCNDNTLCHEVLGQMLSALDYLDSKKLIHRDVKPENILCWGHTFQLADFGLANHRTLAVTKCGTGYYQAPELYPEYGWYDQSPKMDVWSLFATLIDIHKGFEFPPREAKTYSEVLGAVRAAAVQQPNLAHMVRENPNDRASAAQLLVVHFDGHGLTTPKDKVPPIASPPMGVIASTSKPAAPAPTRPAAIAARMNPLVIYPRPPQRKQQDNSKLQLRKHPLKRVQQQPPLLRPSGGRVGKPRVLPHPVRKPGEEDLEVQQERNQSDTGRLRIPGSFPAYA